MGLREFACLKSGNCQAEPIHKFPSRIVLLILLRCGAENTLKLQNLLKDYSSENQLSVVGNLNPKILSFHLWERRYKDELVVDLKLPEYLQEKWNVFENTYI